MTPTDIPDDYGPWSADPIHHGLCVVCGKSKFQYEYVYTLLERDVLEIEGLNNMTMTSHLKKAKELNLVPCICRKCILSMKDEYEL